MCAILYFLIFLGQFWAAENSTLGLSDAEKLTGSGKIKKNKNRGTVIRVGTKETLFHYIVGRAVFLKDCVYRRINV